MCSACDSVQESFDKSWEAWMNSLKKVCCVRLTKNDLEINAKLLVVDYYNKRHSRRQITPDDVVVVCHILGFHKMLLTTDIQDRMYYEVTFDMAGHQETGTFLVYIDAYKLWDDTNYRIESDDIGYFANPRRCDTL